MQGDSFTQTTVRAKDRGKNYWQTKVKNDWLFWRPIVNGVLTFTEASEGGPGLLLEGNAALNEHIRIQNKANKPKGKTGGK